MASEFSMNWGRGQRSGIIARSIPGGQEAQRRKAVSKARFRRWALGVFLVLWGCVPAPTPPSTGTPEPTFWVLPSPSPSATSAVALATTAPLPTPGPSATPVIYTVKSGDTLIGIAVQFGVTVEGIQILNNNIQPESLQPDQRLIIPSQSSAANEGVLPSPTPVGIELGPVACYETPVGSRWCFLEARNPGPDPIENVSALVTLAAADGRPIVTDVAFPAVNLLPAGGSLPMGVLFAPTTERPAGAAAQVQSAEISPNAGGRYLSVSAVEPQVQAEGGTVRVSGQLTLAPDAPGPARLVSLVLTLYNERGHVSGMRAFTVDAGLAPGQSAPFDIAATALAGGVARHQLTLEAQP